jgi:hypothetical protein
MWKIIIENRTWNAENLWVAYVYFFLGSKHVGTVTPEKEDIHT